jgi:hypothetical protein
VYALSAKIIIAVGIVKCLVFLLITKHLYVTERKTRVWYRHTGQPAIERIPSSPTFKTVSEVEIARDLGSHHITHMSIANGVVPHLGEIAPRLTDLKIMKLADHSQLQR